MSTTDLVSEFKDLLELAGIDITDYSDDDIELLLESKLSEITAYVGFDINPTLHKEIRKGFSDDMYEVDYYPVLSVESFKIGNKSLTSDDYVLDDEQGILYLHSALSGLLVLSYSSGISDNAFNSKIKPLLFDMAKYTLTTGFSGVGAMTSIKEGDVQVNYDATSSLGGLIIGRLNNLRASYQCRVKVI